jgi:hypothetical protein
MGNLLFAGLPGGSWLSRALALRGSLASRGAGEGARFAGVAGHDQVQVGPGVEPRTPYTDTLPNRLTKSHSFQTVVDAKKLIAAMSS